MRKELFMDRDLYGVWKNYSEADLKSDDDLANSTASTAQARTRKLQDINTANGRRSLNEKRLLG